MSDIEIDALAAFARGVARPIGRLGGDWFISPQAKQAARTLGQRGWPAYVKGRGSALGDVDADVVVAVFGFMEPERIREAWDEPCALAMDEIKAVYINACRDWSREHLSDFNGLDRLVELLARVSAGADCTAVPLFAAWRASPRPEDAAGRAGQLLMELRELRGGLHLGAVLAAGLTPLEAIVAGPGGTGNAEFFGWTHAEMPDQVAIDSLAPAREQAEAVTDRMVAVDWSALDADERQEVAALLNSALGHVEGVA